MIPGALSLLLNSSENCSLRYCLLKNCAYNIHDNEGIRILTKFRLQFSSLNEHRLRKRFYATSPLCNCGTANEDNKHFLQQVLSSSMIQCMYVFIFFPFKSKLQFMMKGKKSKLIYIYTKFFTGRSYNINLRIPQVKNDKDSIKKAKVTLFP